MNKVSKKNHAHIQATRPWTWRNYDVSWHTNRIYSNLTVPGILFGQESEVKDSTCAKMEVQRTTHHVVWEIDITEEFRHLFFSQDGIDTVWIICSQSVSFGTKYPAPCSKSDEYLI